MSENTHPNTYEGRLVVENAVRAAAKKSVYLTMAEGLKPGALTFDKDVSKLSCCAG